jgi:hypothetical protein
MQLWRGHTHRAHQTQGAHQREPITAMVMHECAPRFATPRTPERATLGGDVALVAKHLGWELMPHQRLVLDIGLEIDPATGTFAYRDVCVTEPRQGGKSTRMLALMMWRTCVYALDNRRYQRCAYSAQSGYDARKKLLHDWVPLVEASAYNDQLTRVYRAGGDEAMQFGMSRVEVTANTVGSAHGKVIDLAVIDEAFDDTDERREQAFMPAMATRDDGQLWVCSTAGTDDAMYLKRKVAQGRRNVVDDVREGSAYFEWSAADEDEAHNPERWPSFIPALGYTITERVVRHAQRTMSAGEFARAFGNVWTHTEEHVIPYADWLECVNDDASPVGGLHLGVDANPDRTYATIVAASKEGTCVEVIDRQPGVGWVVDRITALRGRHDVREVVIHGGGPAGTVLGELERSGANVHIATDTQMILAAGTFYDLVMGHALNVRTSEVLNAAVQGARKRQRGDAFSWARRSPSTDLAPLVAASLATWRAVNDEGGALWLFG